MSRKHRTRDEGPEVEIPVTPMLDMAFQLLTFFIFTYHPSDMEGQMEMALPGAGQYKAKNDADVNPEAMSDPEVDTTAKVTVRVKTQNSVDSVGAINFPIEVEGLSTQPKLVGSLKELEAYLTEQNSGSKVVEDGAAAASTEKPAKPDSVKIEAAGKLKWEFVVEVMDACKRAGYSQVGFSPPPN